jgi:hypothetical protein
MAAQVQPLIKPPRAEQSRSEDRAQRPNPLPIFMARVVVNSCRNSRTSTGKKEAVRLGHRKLIGSQPKRPCARTF